MGVTTLRDSVVIHLTKAALRGHIAASQSFVIICFFVEYAEKSHLLRRRSGEFRAI
jgi:hypothetical protein